MPSRSWQEINQFKPHQPSAEEIENLFAVAERDLAAAQVPGLGDDWSFSIAYNAALQLAIAALYATGYEVPRGESHHFRVIQSLEHTVRLDLARIRKFETFRKKRNVGVYDMAGAISPGEAREMIALARDMQHLVHEWLTKNHRKLAPPK